MADRFAAEEFTEAECWELVSQTVVGRLGVCLEGRPYVFPINFVGADGSFVFRTATGTKLSAARDRQVVFEIDGDHADTGVAWSVIAAGSAREIESAIEWSDAQDLLLFPWHVAPKSPFVRIVVDEISGLVPRTYAGPAGFRRGGP